VLGVDPNQFMYEEYDCCEWVTEDVGIGCCLIVAVCVAGCSFAEDPAKIFVWDLVLFVLSALLVVFVMIWAMFSETVNPMKFSVRGFCGEWASVRTDWVCGLQVGDLVLEHCSSIAFIVLLVCC
jgi:hypothetical protein